MNICAICSFRNFHPPYDHEYKNGCSKWDLINVLRLVSCVAPAAFNLPRTKDGVPSYTLSALADANNIDTKKHDALEDVRALRAMVQLVCQRVLSFCYTHRKKWDVLHLLQGKSTGPPAPYSTFRPISRASIIAVVLSILLRKIKPKPIYSIVWIYATPRNHYWI